MTERAWSRARLARRYEDDHLDEQRIARNPRGVAKEALRAQMAVRPLTVEDARVYLRRTHGLDRHESEVRAVLKELVASGDATVQKVKSGATPMGTALFATKATPSGEIVDAVAALKRKPGTFLQRRRREEDT